MKEKFHTRLQILCNRILLIPSHHHRSLVYFSLIFVVLLFFNICGIIFFLYFCVIIFSLNFVVLIFLHICGIIFSFIFVVNSQPESFLSRATSVWGHSWHLCVLLIKTINSYWKHFSTRLFVHWCRLLFIVKIFLMVSSWWGEKYKWLRCQASLWTNIGKSANRIVRGGSRGAQGGGRGRRWGWGRGVGFGN